jgi:ABC-type multidrug transport system fused ATPase/permease subunit
LVARLSEDATSVRDAFSEKCGQACVSIAQFCGGIGYAFYLSWQLTLAMLATAPIMGMAIALQGYLTVKFTKVLTVLMPITKASCVASEC